MHKHNAAPSPFASFTYATALLVCALFAIGSSTQPVRAQVGMGDCMSSDLAARITACTSLLTNSSLSRDDKATALYFRGDARRLQGDCERAIEDFAASLDVLPEYFAPIFRRADCYAKHKQFDRAEAGYRQASELKPSDARIFNNWAILLNDHMNRPAEALELINTAILIEPQASDRFKSSRYHNKALMLTRLKRSEEALFAYATAVNLNDKAVGTWANKGELELALEHYEQALKTFERALELDPAHTRSMNGRTKAKAALLIKHEKRTDLPGSAAQAELDDCTFEPEFSGAHLNKDDLFIDVTWFSDEASGKLGLRKIVDRWSCIFLEPQIDFIQTGFRDGASVVRIGDDDYILRHDGHLIHMPGLKLMGFSEGLSAATTTDKLVGFVDTQGKWAIEPNFINARQFSEGLAPVWFRSDSGKSGWGYIDRTGKSQTDKRFMNAWPFSEGIATVMAYDDEGKDLFGDPYALSQLIDRGFRTVSAESRTSYAPFSNGRSAFIKGKYALESCGYVDHSGNDVITNRKFEHCHDFSEGFAIVAMERTVEFYINSVKQVSDLTSLYLMDASGNLKMITGDGFGTYAEQPGGFKFSMGLGKVVTSNQTELGDNDNTMAWASDRDVNYIRNTGHYAFGRGFEDGRDFAAGRALVIELDGTTNYIDTLGRVIDVEGVNH